METAQKALQNLLREEELRVPVNAPPANLRGTKTSDKHATDHACDHTGQLADNSAKLSVPLQMKVQVDVLSTLNDTIQALETSVQMSAKYSILEIQHHQDTDIQTLTKHVDTWKVATRKVWLPVWGYK